MPFRRLLVTRLLLAAPLALTLACSEPEPDLCADAIEVLAECEAGAGSEADCGADSAAATTAFSEECIASSDKADLFGRRSRGEACSWDWQCSYDSGLMCTEGVCDHLQVSGPCALPNDGYLALSANEKQAALFALHQASPEVELDAFGGALAALYRAAGIIAPHGAARITDTFTHSCDVFREPTTKRVHALGALAKADWIIDAPGYTGLYAEGRVPALIRFSIANPVLGVSLPSFVPNLEFIPGIGIKLFVDGEPSENLVAMESLAGQGEDHNFFLHRFSNDFSRHAPKSGHPPIVERYGQNAPNHLTMKTIGTRFEQALAFVGHGGDEPFHRPATGLADVAVDGTAAIVPNSPDHLIFEPTAEVLALSEASRSDRDVDFRAKLATIPAGTPVYTIIAVDDGEETPIGSIVLSSAPSTSEWADESYFVQHSR